MTQNLWYRDANYGWLCNNCHMRLVKTGTVVKRSDARAMSKCELMRKTNAALYDKGWECSEMRVSFPNREPTPRIDRYVFRCKHCGREVHWRRSLTAFLNSKNRVCDCVAFKWVFDKDLFRKNSARQQDIAVDIYNNPQLNYSEIAYRNRISRQRVEQIRRTIRARYFVGTGRGETHGQTQEK